MHASLKLIAALCSTGILIGCASSPKMTEARIVPVLDVHHSYESADGYYALGRYYHGSRRLDDALKAYQHALALEPDYPKVRNAMAILYAERGDYQQAIGLLRELVAATPNAAHLFSNLGYAYFLAGEYEAARSNLDKATSLDPTNVRAWSNLGDAWEKLGRTDLARSAYAQARALALGKPSPRANNSPAVPVRSAQVAIETAHPGSLLLEAKPIVEKAAMQNKAAVEGFRTEVKQVSAAVYEVNHFGAASDGSELSRKAAAARQHIEAAMAPNQSPARSPAVAGFEPASNIATSAPALTANAASMRVRVEISNGNGINGMARSVGQLIASATTRVVRLTNQERFDVKTTRIEYKEGFEQAGRSLAKDLGHEVVLIQLNKEIGSDLRLVLGRDMPDTKTVRMHYLNRSKLAGDGRNIKS